MEDEWERELESETDLDLLFIKFDPKSVTIDQLKKKIAEHEFQAEVHQEN